MHPLLPRLTAPTMGHNAGSPKGRDMRDTRTTLWAAVRATFFCLLASAALASTAWAQQQATVAWDANPEPDVVGYYVSYGTAAGQYLHRFDVGLRTSFTFHGLPAGRPFFFSVQAYNRAGLTSPRSAEVSVTIPGAPPADSDGDGMSDQFESQYGATTATGDDDGDGISNLSEYHQGTDPRLPNVWQLAEGSTGFFQERLALVNPSTVASEVSISYLRELGQPVVLDYTIPAESRVTIDVNAVPGIENAAVSALVRTRRGGVSVERTMSWQNGSRAGGHTAKATVAPSTDWYLAEGHAGFFDTWILVANSDAQPAGVTMTFLRDDGTTVSGSYVVGANARLTVFANAVPGLLGRAFSTRVTSTRPVTVERAMYFASWEGGHVSAATTAPATDWFIAEGRTGAFFDMWLLLANPNPQAATATVDFLLPGGGVVKRSYGLAGTSRTTIHVDSIPGLTDTDVSAAIHATSPIVVERAMYWPGGYAEWNEAHNSFGLKELGTQWLLAEGEYGGALGYASYILLANPGANTASVSLRFLRQAGLSPVTITRSVPANARVTVSAQEAGLQQGERFGVLATSTQPIAVERSMYWNSAGRFWGSGTNEVALKMR